MTTSRDDATAKTVLISGGAGDIGRAIARRHLSWGAKVVIVDASADALHEAEQELGASPDRLLGIVGDVTDEAQVVDYVGRAHEFLGRVTAFFNNAGIEGDAEPIPQLSRDSFERVISVNVLGVFLGMKHVLPLMIEQGAGAVVNTASVAGIRGSENLAAYVASKHAVIGLTRTAAIEVASRGVRVNAVCPSGVEGRMIRSIEDKTLRNRGSGSAGDFAARNPTGRLASVDEIANVAAFLASDGASFVNGAAWVIDGGRTVR